MELFKEINFMKAKDKYQKSIERNQKQLQKELVEIQIRKSIKGLNKFTSAINNIK